METECTPVGIISIPWHTKSDGSNSHSLCIGEGPEYRPFRDFRNVPEAGSRGNTSKIREGPVLSGHFPMERRAGIYSLFRNSDRLAGTFHRRRSRLLKTGFFRHVRELKIQRKNPGSALRVLKHHSIE